MWRLAIALTVLAVGIGAGGAALYGASRWRAATEALHARLDGARAPIAQATYDARELDGLPPPVQRYFRAVLREGQPVIAVARFTHTGTFNMGEDAPNWRPFSSSQIVTTQRPGFVWNGRIRMAPGLPALVHDAYVAGEGLLHATLLGMVTLADLRGTPEMAEGELLRYLAEAMWYPTALLPSQGVEWSAIDETSARATLTDGMTTASLDFRFGPDGLIQSSGTTARPRVLGGTVVAAPWSGRGWTYEVHDGMRIPIDAEVAWIQPDGPYPYWRGRIASIAYEYAQSPDGMALKGSPFSDGVASSVIP